MIYSKGFEYDRCFIEKISEEIKEINKEIRSIRNQLRDNPKNNDLNTQLEDLLHKRTIRYSRKYHILNKYKQSYTYSLEDLKGINEDGKKTSVLECRNFKSAFDNEDRNIFKLMRNNEILKGYIDFAISKLGKKQHYFFTSVYLEGKTLKQLAIENNMNPSSNCICGTIGIAKKKIIRIIKFLYFKDYCYKKNDIIEWICFSTHWYWNDDREYFTQLEKLIFYLTKIKYMYTYDIAKLLGMSTYELIGSYKHNMCKKINNFWPVIFGDININRNDRSNKELAEDLGIDYENYHKYIDSKCNELDYHVKKNKKDISVTDIIKGLNNNFENEE